jgi:phosphatidylglycerophosphatase A
MRPKLIKLFSTFFYAGLIPLAPGTAASFIGVLIYFTICRFPALYAGVLLAIIVLGFLVSGASEKVFKQKDPSAVVIDEVAGILIAFCALPLSMPVAWTAFFLFRAFDMFKIYPVNRFESLAGSWGIMMDDIIAGIYTNITMRLALWLAGSVF